MKKRILAILYYILFAFIYVGFLLHKSSDHVVLQYSLKYLLFLIAFSTLFLVPFVCSIGVRKFGLKTTAFITLPGLFVLLFLYGVLSSWYYYNQQHLFDPFLQAPPSTLSPDEIPKKSNTIRILTLGGSTTRNVHLNKKDRYPRVLESILGTHYQQVNIEVFNAGMDFYTTKHSMINYVTNMKDWNPDIVIIMHGINDLSRSFSPSQLAVGPYNRLWTHFYGPSINAAKPPTFMKHFLGKYYFAWYSQLRMLERDIPLERYVSINEFSRHLSVLVDIIRQDSIDVILMTQPSLYKNEMNSDELSVLWFGRSYCNSKKNRLQSVYSSARSLRAAMNDYNGRIRKIAMDKNVHLIDLEPQIPKDRSNFVDDIHYTVKSSHQVAQIITKNITDANLVD